MWLPMCWSYQVRVKEVNGGGEEREKREAGRRRKRSVRRGKGKKEDGGGEGTKIEQEEWKKDEYLWNEKKIVGEPAMYIDAGDVNKSNIARYTNDGREVVTYRDKHKEDNYRGRNDNSNTGNNDNRDCLHAEFEMCHLGSYCPHDNSNCQDKQIGNSPCINNSNSNNDSSDSGSDSSKIAYSAGNTVIDNNNSDGCSNNKNNIETRNNALFCYVVTPAGNRKAYLQALRDIFPDEEILVDYGDSYWEQ